MFCDNERHGRRIFLCEHASLWSIFGSKLNCWYSLRRQEWAGAGVPIKENTIQLQSTIDGYEVRDYKYRRQGQVLFEIFADYKIHFDRYLTWRDEMFAESTDRLFPFVRQMGAAESTPPGFDQMKRKICKSAGIPSLVRETSEKPESTGCCVNPVIQI